MLAARTIASLQSNPYAPPLAPTAVAQRPLPARTQEQWAHAQTAAFVCPKCGDSARPSPGRQSCTRCRLAFRLVAGQAGDASVVPAALTGAEVTVKWAGLVLYYQGVVAPDGILSGELDPVIGMVSMSQSFVPYGYVISLAVWRRLDVVALVIALLVPTPLALGLGVLALQAPVALVAALFFAALAAWMIYLAVVVGKRYLRVCGAGQVLEIRFDRPLWRRKAFLQEAVRRTGVAADTSTWP